MHKGPLFSMSSPTFVISYLVDTSHSNRFWFAVISLMINNVEFFYILVGHLCIFFEKKNVCSDLPIFKPDCFLFCYWVIWILYIFWILAPYQVYDLKLFSPFSSLPFYFVGHFLSYEKDFQSDEVPLIYCYFYCFCCQI